MVYTQARKKDSSTVLRIKRERVYTNAKRLQQSFGWNYKPHCVYGSKKITNANVCIRMQKDFITVIWMKLWTSLCVRKQRTCVCECKKTPQQSFGWDANVCIRMQNDNNNNKNPLQQSFGWDAKVCIRMQKDYNNPSDDTINLIEAKRSPTHVKDPVVHVKSSRDSVRKHQSNPACT